MSGTTGDRWTCWISWILVARVWRQSCFLGCVLLASLRTANAAPNFNTQDPLAFFTGTAEPMIRYSTAQWCAQGFSDYTNTFGTLTTNAFSITNIPVFINGAFVYSPAVNRLLQLAANVYDVTTNSPYPSVFSPLFSSDGAGDVYITGYTNVVPFADGAADVQLSAPTDIAALAALPSFTNLTINVYGVPWIIGAKKGLPNFNEFSMINTLSVKRRLMMTRPTTNSATSVNLAAFHTNQMYMMNLSSSLGIELWNSYTNNYPDPVLIAYRENASLTITNDEPGFELDVGSQPLIFSTNQLVSLNNWPGTGTSWLAGNPNPSSFVVPLNASLVLMTNMVYRTSYAPLTPGTLPAGFPAPCLISANYFGLFGMPVLYETNTPGFPFPQFGLLLTNRLQVFILDLDTSGVYHVIDYVQFAGPNSAINVNYNLADLDNAGNNFGTGVWDTNYTPGSAAPNGLTYGIRNQIAVSKSGSPPAEDGVWVSDAQGMPYNGTIAQEQAYFSAFFLPGNKSVVPVAATNLQLAVQAPYSPTRYVVQYFTWQANDPLVHYLASDINNSLAANAVAFPRPGVSYYNAGQIIQPLTGLNLGLLNDRYAPWGGNPHFVGEGQASQLDTNIYNLAERDPLMWHSDNWNFPSNPFSTFDWIGRIHRGTPWQTVYLKADDVLATTGLSAWEAWTGNFNPFDAINSAPVQDWHLASLLTSILNTNPVGQLVSVNNTNLNTWLVLLDGLTAWTNSQSDVFNSVLISSNSPQAAVIVNAIQSARSSFPGQSFGDVGDILATEQMTEQSPFLDWGDVGQQQSGITDEAYEIIPSQLLSLLRMDSSGAVAWSNGQLVVNFTGWNVHPYAIQVSHDLINWVSISTNYPVNGIFSYTNSAAAGSTPQFYRTLLLQ